MPRLSVWLVRLALLYLLAGFVLGGALLAGKGLGLWAGLWAWRPLHVEFLLFGWMVQLVIGVGTWILPRTAARSSTRPITLALILLNVGLWSAGLGTMLGLPGMLLAGRLGEMGAVVAFVYHIWPRVRSFREKLRKG